MGSRYFSKRIPDRTAIRTKRNRPKTFKTEESAKKYAEEQGIKSYTLFNLKNTASQTKKLRIIAK